MARAIDAEPPGSSPLTRGKQWQKRRPGDQGRLIPAHAGKTCFWSCLQARSRAHPRSRGENTDRAVRALGVAGSSPLTRGKLDRRGRLQARAGLIPAHAGKTC